MGQHTVLNCCCHIKVSVSNGLGLTLLNINKAKNRLGWKPRLNMQQCMALVVDWYKRYKSMNVYQLCIEEIEKFIGE